MADFLTPESGLRVSFPLDIRPPTAQNYLLCATEDLQTNASAPGTGSLGQFSQEYQTFKSSGLADRC